MTRQEMILEIAAIKQKLAYSASCIESTNLTIALMALYDSIIALDNNYLEKIAA